ncbi:MAG TPA: hypothetical protein VGV09_17535 [Steroidobacteraceae bacterium]|nr:hypothetical protein [Steroidobacteraceae bacterium]
MARLAIRTSYLVLMAALALAGPAHGDPVPEVTVIGKMDPHTLNHVIQQFVQSHDKPSALIGQIGRWRDAVCPAVSGLQGTADGFVASRITNVAHAVGAPGAAPGKPCVTNVEVVFTPSPQQLLDHIAEKYHPLLGFYRVSEHKQTVTFSHPIQAWYRTGTRTVHFDPPPMCVPRCEPPNDGMGKAGFPTATEPFNNGFEEDSDQSAGGPGSFGVSGGDVSPFTHGLRSEFLHVLIIVDSKAVAKFPLQGIADYVAMLSLTRLASLDDCSDLPSIVNLFATHCAAAPSTLTTADISYLKALYGADLEQNLNLEQYDMHARMLKGISGQ